MDIGQQVRLDSHCHFWSLERGDYGWLQGNDAALAKIRKNFSPSDYPRNERVIAVQAAPTVDETDYLLSLSLQYSFIAGVVGWVDLASPKSVGDLSERATNPKFKSIRPMLQDIAQTDWLLTAPHGDVLKCLIQLGLRFDALVTERHLPVVLRFAAQNPKLPIVIDHGAKPQPGDKSNWEHGMRALAHDKGIYCKISGLLTELSVQELSNPLPVLDSMFGRLLDWFGPDRLMWGSDWPVLTLASQYDDWVGYTEELLSKLTSSERAAILGGTASRFYGIAD